jgi:hypothetical protein
MLTHFKAWWNGLSIWSKLANIAISVALLILWMQESVTVAAIVGGTWLTWVLYRIFKK